MSDWPIWLLLPFIWVVIVLGATVMYYIAWIILGPSVERKRLERKGRSGNE